MLPKMSGAGYRQISPVLYAVLYVVTLCCCFSPHVQGRTLASLKNSKPLFTETTGLARHRRSLSELETILSRLERNRQSAYGDTGADLDLANLYVRELSNGALGISQKSSLSGTSLENRADDVVIPIKRGQRPCYWNVVSCYGKKWKALKARNRVRIFLASFLTIDSSRANQMLLLVLRVSQQK